MNNSKVLVNSQGCATITTVYLPSKKPNNHSQPLSIPSSLNHWSTFPLCKFALSGNFTLMKLWNVLSLVTNFSHWTSHFQGQCGNVLILHSLLLPSLACSMDIPGSSLIAQMVKNPPAMWETWVQSPGWADPLEEGMATHSSTLAWRIPWTEGPGGP